MGDDLICTKNGIALADVLRAVREGCSAPDEIVSGTGMCGACSGCKALLSLIVEPVCDCLGVSAADIAQALDDGALTLEKMFAATGIGAVCGRYKGRAKKIFNILKIPAP